MDKLTNELLIVVTEKVAAFGVQDVTPRFPNIKISQNK